MARGRANKKRRTEVSSSEDTDSSSSESEIEQQQEQQEQHNEVSEKLTADDVSMKDVNIDNLQTHDERITEKKSDDDLMETRLRLRRIEDKVKNSEHSQKTEGGISSDEWLGMMVEEYGEDLEKLRTTAADFKGESVALVAELLRSSQNVFKEV